MDETAELQRALEALSAIEGLGSITRGWPRREAALPCVAVQLGGAQSIDMRDDAPYLTTQILEVRCFSRSSTELDALVTKVKAVMEALGYRREMTWEDFNQEVCQRVERYSGAFEA